MVEEKRDNPVLLNFQNAEMGYKSNAQTQCFRAEDVDRAKRDSDDPVAKHSRMAVVISGQQAYRGYLGEGLPTDLMSTYVAIRNKKTGKMRLIQLEECNMLNACYDDNKNKFQEQESSLTVMRKFGGKTAIRALERIERSGSNIDVMNDTIQQTVRTYDDEQFNEDNVFSKAKLEGELILASMKPSKNPKAKTPVEQYLFEDMLMESTLKSLRTAGFGLMKKDPESLELSNVYLTNKIKTALQSKDPDSDENVRILQICLYMDALSRLLQTNAKNFDKMTLTTYSNELFFEIKQRFSETQHHKLLKTKYSTHKALTHYLAMAFVLENGALNVDQVHAGLNITKNELLKFASFIGGSYNSAKNLLTLRMTGSESASRPFVNRRGFGKWK